MWAEAEYYAIGGNCHPSAADWNADANIFAYGAGSNVGICLSHDDKGPGLCQLMTGHSARVTAVRFILANASICIITGSANGEVGLWCSPDPTNAPSKFELAQKNVVHSGSIDCIGATKNFAGFFLTGSADGLVKLWKTGLQHQSLNYLLHQTISIENMMPLSIAMHSFTNGDTICAVSGTRKAIELYALDKDNFLVKQTSLGGHDGWVRALNFFQYPKGLSQSTNSVALASASQDKLIRIWKISLDGWIGPDYGSYGEKYELSKHDYDLSGKSITVHLLDKSYKVTFEALLAGHEDWIYSVRWILFKGRLRLLSASADNTVIIWELNPSDDLWNTVGRVGELSIQKGSTSATGSMGGFWNCLWSPDGEAFISLTKTGSWRRWQLSDSGIWQEKLSLCGHTRPVTDLTWAQNGIFLLSASSDQTSRLHAEWTRGAQRTWHEVSRPQIHGYDINCIGALGDTMFISGSDEKLLRVFDLPDEIAELLATLRNVSLPSRRQIHTADIPVLGLSNKSDETTNKIPRGLLCTGSAKLEDFRTENDTSTIPPLENCLSRQTLWPEKEKLYGHGLEICALAVSLDGSFIASSCKASSLDHAVIRVFSTHNWQQMSPPLKVHTLTVTSLQFSDDSKMLLSAGRDRQIALWHLSDQNTGQTFTLYAKYPRAHTRMIFSATWLQCNNLGKVFATSARDKSIKIWSASSSVIKLHHEIITDTAVTAMHGMTSRSFKKEILLATGTETGQIKIYRLVADSFGLLETFCVQQSNLPSSVVNRIAWRPSQVQQAGNSPEPLVEQLAIASEDHSLRILSIRI